MSFLVDENMPRSTAAVLREAGYDAEDVRDVGLAGRDDALVFRYAQDSGATLLTADKDFSNILEYAPGTHAGIIVLRPPDEWPTRRVHARLLDVLSAVAEHARRGALIVLQAERTRVRHPSGETEIGP